MPSIMDTIQQTILETIEKGINESLPKLDPVASKIVTTSAGVSQPDWGRGWKVKHVFETGQCGGIEYPGFRDGGSVIVDGHTESFSVFGAGNGWPGPNEMTGPGFVTSTISIPEARGGFPVPSQLWRTDRMNSSIGKILTSIIRGTARKINQSDINALYKQTKGAIVRATSNGSDTSIPNNTTGTTMTISSGRVRSLEPGMLVDVYTNSNGPNTLVNTAFPVAVKAVNYYTGTFTLRGIGGATSITANTTYWLLPKNSNAATAIDTAALASSRYPMGWIDWIKNSATGATVYDIDVSPTGYPQFSSIVVSNLSGVLTSDILNKYIGGYIEAFDSDLDTIMTTQGVLNAFLENLDTTSQLIRYDLQGKALNVKAGFSGFGYMFDGMPLEIKTSRHNPQGMVRVVKLGGGNLRKYVPPKMENSVGQSQFAGEVEFMGKALGSSSIFMPLYNPSANVTDIVFAPFVKWCQFAAVRPQSVELSTFTENIYQG